MGLGGWARGGTIHPRGNASFHQNGSLKGVADPPKFSKHPFRQKPNIPFPNRAPPIEGLVLMLFDPRSATNRSNKYLLQFAKFGFVSCDLMWSNHHCAVDCSGLIVDAWPSSAPHSGGLFAY